MTKKVINHVQDYLTVVGEDKVYQIVNVELLLRRHPPEAVIAFLQQLRSEYQKELGQLIKNNVFVPNDTGWKHNNCAYRKVCDEWFLRRAA